MNGQVVGINTIKIVDTQFEGMGFAIPSVTIKKVADDIIKNGYVTGRARLGIVVTEFPDATAKLYKAPAGIKVETIDKDSSFKDTKVKEGDIITEIDGTTVSSFNELYNVLDLYKPGDTVTLTIYRIDKKDTAKNKEFKVDIELLGD
jgi:serine protease Do